MMWCSWVQKRMVVPEDQGSWPFWVARHVEHCDECRKFVRQMSGLRQSFASEALPPVDEEAVRCIMDEVHRVRVERSDNTESEAGEVVELFQPSWGLRLALVSALLVLLVAYSVEWPRLSSPQGQLAAEPPVQNSPVQTGPTPSPRAAPLTRPIFIYVEPGSPVPPRWGPVAAASNVGPAVEFGGVPVTPVSFGY